MKTVNSISGGKTSAYIAVHYPADYEVFSLVCIDDKNCKPKDTLINTYVNLKLEKFAPEYGEFIATAEDDKTLYAMMDLEQILGRDQDEDYGIFKNVIIDQHSVGDSGDSYAGAIYANVNGKWIRVYYEC